MQFIESHAGWFVVAVIFLLAAINIIDMGRKRD